MGPDGCKAPAAPHGSQHPTPRSHHYLRPTGQPLARRRAPGVCITVDDMQKTTSPRLLQAAMVIFAIGLIALVALFVTPLVTDGDTAPTFVYLLTMCAPLGFLLGLVYALRAGRRAR